MKEYNIHVRSMQLVKDSSIVATFIAHIDNYVIPFYLHVDKYSTYKSVPNTSLVNIDEAGRAAVSLLAIPKYLTLLELKEAIDNA